MAGDPLQGALIDQIADAFPDSFLVAAELHHQSGHVGHNFILLILSLADGVVHLNSKCVHVTVPLYYLIMYIAWYPLPTFSLNFPP